MEIAWRLNLELPPQVLQTAVTTHGAQNREETYRDLRFCSLHAYRYRADLAIDGNWYRITPQTVSVFAPGRRMQFRYRGPSEHVYAHFLMEMAPTARWEVSAVQDLGRESRRVDRAIREAAGWFAAQPARASARVWDVLWDLARPAREEADAPHPAIVRAMELIETRLGRPIDLAQVVRAAGVSHNHLIRLFRRHTGRSIVAYIRHRRALLARHLIVGTDQPIKAIAAQVGLSDLQQFNKTMRKEFGQSPSAMRPRQI